MVVHYTVSTLVTQEQIHTTKFPPLYEKYICNEKKTFLSYNLANILSEWLRTSRKATLGSQNPNNFLLLDTPPPPQKHAPSAIV